MGDNEKKWLGALGLLALGATGLGAAGIGPLAGLLGGSGSATAAGLGGTAMEGMVGTGTGSALASAGAGSSVGSFLAGAGEHAATGLATQGAMRAATPTQKVTQFDPTNFQTPQMAGPQPQGMRMTSNEEQLRKLGFA